MFWIGERPLPSCLGGGDLDGDEYNLIPLDALPEFNPSKLYAPAMYDAAPKKFLDRPSTMADVADFFVDYISSDVSVSVKGFHIFKFKLNTGAWNHRNQLDDNFRSK